MSFPRVLYAPFGEEFNNYSDTLGNFRYEVGQKMMLPDGRTFRLGTVGATTLIAGTMTQSAVPVSNHIGQTIVTATALGATSAPFTVGNTPVDFDLYRNGLFVDESGGTGLGYYYPVASHNNVAASAVMTVPFQTGYKVQVAINTSDVCSLIMSPWKNTVIAATAGTAGPAGVTLTPATTLGSINTTGGNAKGVQMGQLVWLQTGGLCVCRTDATAVVAGEPVGTSATVAGDITLQTTTTIFTHMPVGWCVRVAASGAWSTVYLLLDN